MHLRIHNRQSEGLFVLVHSAALAAAALGLMAYYTSREASELHALGAGCVFAAAAAFAVWRASAK